MILVATSTFTPGNIPGVVKNVVRQRVIPAVQRSQKIIAAEAQRLVRVRTGELRDSITPGEVEDDGSQVTGPVMATAGHAAFEEFGTGVLGMGTYPWDLPQENVPITGSWDYDYRRVGYRGRPAAPFMRPSLDASRGAVLEEFSK